MQIVGDDMSKHPRRDCSGSTRTLAGCFGRLVCGLDSTKLLPPRLNYDETRAYADIQRAYLQKSDLIAPPEPVVQLVEKASQPPKTLWPPSEEKGDLIA